MTCTSKKPQISCQSTPFSEDAQQQAQTALLEFLSVWHASLNADPNLCELADSLKQAAAVSGMILDLDASAFEKRERFLDSFSEDSEFVFFESGPVRASS
ncbi:hypothetical protein [Pelagimonas varians]|uniref:Uncharacterized protein n=1 Tax=Pelagimonas varians TaxID=696760 RepID=A0A238KEU7_9RHOB|nr:hypothetical protein [Pelagimonas varians]PYG32431.1 hypothetical protein C8N36_103180 [Pelagimonas varians]SMX41349.1 hypothetical protein PEV8663_02250 [Pelagimonas varians]